MIFAFTGIVILFLFISSFKWPGITVAYMFFFQILNNAMFEQVGLQSFKYITSILLLPILYYNCYSKIKVKVFKKLVLNSIISKVYFSLLLYIILHGCVPLFLLPRYLAGLVCPVWVFFGCWVGDLSSLRSVRMTEEDGSVEVTMRK